MRSCHLSKSSHLSVFVKQVSKLCDLILTRVTQAFIVAAVLIPQYLTWMVYLLLHVPVSLLVLLHPRPISDGGRGALDGNLVQLEELLTQAVLQVLVQLAAGGELGWKCCITRS